MNLKNDVNNFKAEMESTGSIEGVTDMMKKVKNSDASLSDKVKLIGALKTSFDNVVGNDTETDRYNTNKILYSNANGKTHKRKVSYRAKYTGNFSGVVPGSGRTTRF